jgi:hypothetical protein
MVARDKGANNDLRLQSRFYFLFEGQISFRVKRAISRGDVKAER